MNGIQDFRVLLQNEFARRCRQNPLYSLRSFARYLAVEPSALSKLMRGHRSFSVQMINKLGPRLGLASHEVERYLPNSQPITGEVVGAKTSQELSAQGDKNYETIATDTFEIVGDWLHFAIHEIVRLRGFKADPKWIAKRLCVPLNDVNLAIDRLQRVGMLEVLPTGRWRPAQIDITTIGTEMMGLARQRFVKRALELAISAVDSDPDSARRSVTGFTVAINSKRLPEAKERIKIFRREMMEFLEAGNDLHEVYQMAIALYPVSHRIPGDSLDVSTDSSMDAVTDSSTEASPNP